MKTDDEARTILIRARTALYIDEPMYGILALRLLLQEDRGIKTLCVSHTTIYYNPDFVKTLGDSLAKSAMAHEISHCIYDHVNRCGARNPKKYNAAADYVINAALKADGFEIGPTWLYNKAYDGMTSDHIYTLLPDAPDDEHGALDEMRPGDPDENDVVATEWKIATVQAATEAKKQGKLPASMKRVVDELTDAKVDWRAHLRRFATEHSKSDYSWSRPQRRMVPFGFYLPSLYSQAMGLLVNGIDTSGSIDQYILDAFGSEITAMKNAVRPEKLINIYCDCRVNKIDEFGEFDLPTYEMCGGGGTDFRPPFEHIAQNDLKPACFIYLTDGEGPFPKSPPPYPVLWVMTTDIIAPFGETVRIDV